MKVSVGGTTQLVKSDDVFGVHLSLGWTIQCVIRQQIRGVEGVKVGAAFTRQGSSH